MNKIFAIILLLSFLWGKPTEWSFEQNLALQKDELFTASITTGENPRDFSLRWTLFKKDGVVMLLKYDGFVRQFILYPDIQRNSFVLRLDGAREDSALRVVFKGFEDGVANFWLGVEGDALFAPSNQE